MAELDPTKKNKILKDTRELNTKYKDQINLYKYDYLSTVYLAFYLDNNEAIDLKLRQAINYGIDKESMVKYLMNGVATAADGGFIPKGLPGYKSNSTYSYQPQKARQLVKEYFNENGRLPKIQLTTVQSEERRVGKENRYH